MEDRARFIGHHQRRGQAPVAHHGTRRERESPSGAADGGPADPDGLSEGEAWRPGGSWLPLGGSLSMESLTSPSGRFTALHAVYEPQFAVRDNATGERVWICEAPGSSHLCLGPDGDLVARDHHGNRVWSTGTGWRGVRRLEMRDSGELALTDAEGAVVWSTGVPHARPAETGPRAVARGATMRRGEGLYGQSLTSHDGSTVLFHDGRVWWVIVRGLTSHEDRFPERENVLALDDDGFLRSRALDGTVLEEIAGPGAELTVVRGAAELRDDAGSVVWQSAPPVNRPAPAREPAMPANEDLAAWFRALAGEDRGYCVAVVSESTPREVLRRAGLPEGAAVRGTWRQLQRRRDDVAPDSGSVVAAVAVGPDTLLLCDDDALDVTALAPSTSVTAVHQPCGEGGFGGAFSLHRAGRLVAELRDDPRRRKGTKVPEVAAALNEVTHPLHRHELVFRTCGVVPRVAEWGGPLLGGVLVPERPLGRTPAAGTTEPGMAVEGYDGPLTPLVVRTHFGDESAWERVVGELRLPWGDDSPVEPYLICDSRYAGASAERVLKDVRTALAEEGRPGVVFVADGTTLRETGHPLLAVSTEWDGEPFAEDEEGYPTRFRLVPDAAVEVSTNLGLGNMDFEDFAGDRLYRRVE